MPLLPAVVRIAFGFLFHRCPRADHSKMSRVAFGGRFCGDDRHAKVVGLDCPKGDRCGRPTARSTRPSTPVLPTHPADRTGSNIRRSTTRCELAVVLHPKFP